MFGNSNFDRIRQIFADQFSDNPKKFIYRKNQKGAPILVTALERDEFIEVFNKRIRYATWSMVPATVILILLLTWLIPDAESPTADMMLWVGFAAVLLPFISFFYWAWNAPSRELRHRAPEGAALTREAARALTFSKISYGQLTLVAVMGAGLIWKKSGETDTVNGWGVIWLVVGGGLIAIAGVQAFRKWHHSH